MPSRARKVYRRPIYDEILERAHEPRGFIQVLKNTGTGSFFNATFPLGLHRFPSL